MTSTQISPSEVDTKLADLWYAVAKIDAKLESNRVSLAHDLNIRGEYHGRSRTPVYPPISELEQRAAEQLYGELAPWVRSEILRTLDTRKGLIAERAHLRSQAEPLEAIYNEQRWSRFFLVTNTNGHIHSSLNCSTCHPTTEFAWLPELSGLTEKDAVDAHGARLCTVCFPSAPVEWTNKFDLEAEAKAAEKAKTQCPGSGTWDHDSSGLRYNSPRARCNHCHQTISVTSTGKLRGHKPKVTSS